jgi:enterochelin esterase family protein
LRVHSRILQKNPLGDPATRDVFVFVPRTYAERPEQRFPVLYWLPAFGALPSAYIFDTATSRSLVTRWLASGLDCLVVIPDCNTRYGGSQYIDSPGSGRYQSFLLDEVIPAVDGAFRTVRERWGRAIGGRSSGGFGAITAVLDHPSLFAGALSIAPDAGFEHCYLPFFPGMLDLVRRHGGMARFVETPQEIQPRDSEFMLSLSLLAMAACYSSHSDGSFDFPVDPDTGNFRPEIWERWRRHDPVNRVKQNPHGPAEAPFLYLDVGTRDEYNMHWGARALRSNLSLYRGRVLYSEFEGGHSGAEHRYDPLFQCVAAAFARVEGPCAA